MSVHGKYMYYMETVLTDGVNREFDSNLSQKIGVFGAESQGGLPTFWGGDACYTS